MKNGNIHWVMFFCLKQLWWTNELVANGYRWRSKKDRLIFKQADNLLKNYQNSILFATERFEDVTTTIRTLETKMNQKTKLDLNCYRTQSTKKRDVWNRRSNFAMHKKNFERVRWMLVYLFISCYSKRKVLTDLFQCLW